MLIDFRDAPQRWISIDEASFPQNGVFRNYRVTSTTIFAYYSPMGGERASKTRMRSAGQICGACGRSLPHPDTPGERYCDQCKPPVKVAYVGFEHKKAWEVVISDSTTQQRLCTLVFWDEDKIIELARRGGGMNNLEAKQSMERAIQNGHGGVFLKLTPAQYAKLKGK